MAAQKLLMYKLERLKANDLREFVHSFCRHAEEDIYGDNAGEGTQIGDVLTECDVSRLESLKLRFNDVDHWHDTVHVRRFLEQSSTLREFTISGKYAPMANLFVQSLQQNHFGNLQKVAIKCRDIPMKAVCEMIRTTNTLKHLELCGNRIRISGRSCVISQAAMTNLLNALSTNESLEQLELYVLDLSGYRYPAAANDNDFTASRSTIRHLKLTDNLLHENVFESLVKTLPMLQSLVFNGNDIKSNDGIFGPLLDSTHPVQTLESFHFASGYFEPPRNGFLNQDPLYDLVHNNPSLVDLTLCDKLHDYFDEKLMTQLGKGLVEKTTMKSLVFTSPLTEEDLDLLLEPLETRVSPLTIEDLSLEFKGEATVPGPLLRLLINSSCNCTVTKLTLDFGELTNDICHELWMALRQNKTLESLTLKGHGHDRDIQSLAAFRSLADGVANGLLPSLKELRLDEGMRESLMGLKCLIAFPLDLDDDNAMLSATGTLEKLTLSRMVLGDAMIDYCAKVMAHPLCFMEHLALEGCRLSMAGALTLLESLTLTTCVLTSFHLSLDGTVSFAAAKSFASVLPRIKHLKKLTLEGLNHVEYEQRSRLKDVFLKAAANNKSIQSLNLDLEKDGFSFPAHLRFYGFRNQIDAFLSSHKEETTGANFVGIQDDWIPLLGLLSDEENGCHSAAFYMLTRKVGTLHPW